MKTSIIVSTVAALCLMITIAEAPINRDAQNNIETLYNNISYTPATMVNSLTESNIAAVTSAGHIVNTKTNTNTDFNYLKFNVADYMTSENNETEVTFASQFDYLKFDVNKFETSDDANAYESVESPSNEFDYLKFDVSKYGSDYMNSVQNSEMPVTE